MLAYEYFLPTNSIHIHARAYSLSIHYSYARQNTYANIPHFQTNDTNDPFEKVKFPLQPNDSIDFSISVVWIEAKIMQLCVIIYFEFIKIIKQQFWWRKIQEQMK